MQLRAIGPFCVPSNLKKLPESSYPHTEKDDESLTPEVAPIGHTNHYETFQVSHCSSLIAPDIVLELLLVVQLHLGERAHAGC